MVRGTACHWERLQIGPSQRADGSIAAPAFSVNVPVALRLDFTAAAVWFVAGIPQLPDPRRVFIPGDEIIVIFSSEKMRDMGFDNPTFLQASQQPARPVPQPWPEHALDQLARRSGRSADRGVRHRQRSLLTVPHSGQHAADRSSAGQPVAGTDTTNDGQRQGVDHDQRRVVVQDVTNHIDGGDIPHGSSAPRR
jgi:hypothetical protein